MQQWKKIGVIYDKQHYNAVPVANLISDNLLRIYFTSRNEQNFSIPFYIDFDLESLIVVSEVQLNIPLGKLGSFDENGVMPTSLIKVGDKIFLYYIGWNIGKTVPFRNAIGLAISKDNGRSFEKFSEGPLLDRSVYDKCFVASNCVYKEKDFYRMYYLSCDSWQVKNDALQHSYNIKYAESKDGINWHREGKVVIDFKFEEEYAISVPRVLKDEEKYMMWYSYRGSPKGETYRIGYAESLNGLDWKRMDDQVGLDVSNFGWDSEMICYPDVFDHQGRRYMLYNGNQYGKSGIGLAILD